MKGNHRARGIAAAVILSPAWRPFRLSKESSVTGPSLNPNPGTGGWGKMRAKGWHCTGPALVAFHSFPFRETALHLITELSLRATSTSQLTLVPSFSGQTQIGRTRDPASSGREELQAGRVTLLCFPLTLLPCLNFPTTAHTKN